MKTTFELTTTFTKPETCSCDKTEVSIISIIISSILILIVGALISGMLVYCFLKRRFEREQPITSEYVNMPSKSIENQRDDIRKVEQDDTEDDTKPYESY